MELTAENIGGVPAAGGVYQLLGESENVICIKGAADLQKALKEQLESHEKARYFCYEEEPMYTKRESQLLQQFLTEHGEMPEDNQELDDLF